MTMPAAGASCWLGETEPAKAAVDEKAEAQRGGGENPEELVHGRCSLTFVLSCQSDPLALNRV